MEEIASDIEPISEGKGQLALGIDYFCKLCMTLLHLLFLHLSSFDINKHKTGIKVK